MYISLTLSLWISVSSHIPIKGKFFKNILAMESYIIKQTKRHLSTSNSEEDQELIRINKCFPNFSRRASDLAISNGEVTVNDVVATLGQKIKPSDIVKHNNIIVYPNNVSSEPHLYIKYWKPKGVICTNDERVPDNILHRGKFWNLPRRVFTVGRLDKDSTGLILLTSDGRINNKVLLPQANNAKDYEVKLNRVPTDSQLADMANGVYIESEIKRDTWATSSTIGVVTKPCTIKLISSGGRGDDKSSGRVDGGNGSFILITLREGRNRQIRKMAEAVGLSVVELHRTKVSGIDLSGLSGPGDWRYLNRDEMELLRQGSLLE
jgi:23S rRNA pseudouridine2604 synthase